MSSPTCADHSWFNVVAVESVTVFDERHVGPLQDDRTSNTYRERGQTLTGGSRWGWGAPHPTSGSSVLVPPKGVSPAHFHSIFSIQDLEFILRFDIPCVCPHPEMVQVWLGWKSLVVQGTHTALTAGFSGKHWSEYGSFFSSIRAMSFSREVTLYLCFKRVVRFLCIFSIKSLNDVNEPQLYGNTMKTYMGWIKTLRTGTRSVEAWAENLFQTENRTTISEAEGLQGTRGRETMTMQGFDQYIINNSYLWLTIEPPSIGIERDGFVLKEGRETNYWQWERERMNIVFQVFFLIF